MAYRTDRPGFFEDAAAWPAAMPGPLAHPSYFKDVLTRRMGAFGLDLVMILMLSMMLWLPWSMMVMGGLLIVIVGVMTGFIWMLWLLVPVMSLVLLGHVASAMWIVAPIAYAVVTVGSRHAATPGMRVMQLQMRDCETGGRPEYWQALVGSLVFYFGVFGAWKVLGPQEGVLMVLLGCALPFVNIRRRMLQDFLAGTIVVRVAS